MKKSLFLVILLVFTIQQNAKAENDDFVKIRGVQLMLNGSPYYANGFNAYWFMLMASDPSTKYRVTSAFQQASKSGLTTARSFVMGEGGPRPLQYSPGKYNEQMFQGMDFVISEASKYGFKLVLGLVNNFNDLGGKKQYVEWARSQGQSLSSDDDFYTNSVVKGFYKNHVQTVLTRRNTVTGVAYKDDPTIMAWELMNEPRCPSDISGKTLQAWITEMAAYLKSIDGNHLLEIGLEGFGQNSSEEQQYNPNFQVGTDFIANNQIPGIDFATIHSYPDAWYPSSSEETQLSALDKWLDAHIQDAQNILKKPILLAEFGKSFKDPGYSIQQREEVFNKVYSKVFSSASSGGAAAGSMFWQLLVEGMDNFGDGYEVILSKSPSTTTLIAQQSQKLNKIRKM